MEITNEGEWVPTYLGEGPDRRLVGKSRFKDGKIETVFDESDDPALSMITDTNPHMSFRLQPSALEFEFVPVRKLEAVPLPKYKQPFPPLQLDTSLPRVPQDQTEWQQLIRKVIDRQEQLLGHAVVYGAQIRHLEDRHEEENAAIMRREWLRYRDSHEEDDFLFAKLQEAYYLGYEHTELYERIMTGKPLD